MTNSRDFDKENLAKWERVLAELGFQKTRDEIKKAPPMPYQTEERKWQLITYEHPVRREKVKIRIGVQEDLMEVFTDFGKKPQTAWKHFDSIEGLKQHFK